MAETGVVESAGTRPGRTGDHVTHSGMNDKRKKMLIIGGVGAGAFLLMAHKGSQSSGSGGANSDLMNAQAQLQQQSDLLAAEESAMQSGVGVTPSGDVTGGSFGNGTDTTGNDPGSTSDNTLTNPTNGSTSAPGTQLGPININVPATPQGPAAPATKGHKGKKGQDKKGGHKSQNKAHNPGASGHGHGVTVHGRHFPGGKHATVHPPRRVGNDVHQKVTVNHGGHTSTHTSVNGGQHWIDNKKGANPPNRGTESHHGSVNNIHHSERPAPAHPSVTARREHRPVRGR